MSIDQGELKVLMRDALEKMADDKAKLAVEAILINLKSRLDSWVDEPFDKSGKAEKCFNLDNENIKEFWTAIVQEAFKK